MSFVHSALNKLGTYPHPAIAEPVFVMSNHTANGSWCSVLVCSLLWSLLIHAHVRKAFCAFHLDQERGRCLTN
jgi:hypothetical protein